MKSAINIPPRDIILDELEACQPGDYKPFPPSGTKILWLNPDHHPISLAEFEGVMGEITAIKLLNNSIRIDDNIATKLETLFGVNKYFWLNLQRLYDERNHPQVRREKP